MAESNEKKHGDGRVRPGGCLCGVEEPDEFCPYHGRSYKELVAEVTRLRAEVERLQDEWRGMRDHLRAAADERDTLSAVLAETPENVSAVAKVMRHWACCYGDGGAPHVLADQRARAGMAQSGTSGP